MDHCNAVVVSLVCQQPDKTGNKLCVPPTVGANTIMSVFLVPYGNHVETGQEATLVAFQLCIYKTVFALFIVLITVVIPCHTCQSTAIFIYSVDKRSVVSGDFRFGSHM